MSTETKSENTATTIDNKTSNKALFGPLGKYAIIGVIMVSIMITTVIFLNKQLGTASEHVATIEKELAESKASESTTSIDTTSAIESENNQTQQNIEVAEVEVTPVEVEATAVKTSKVPATETKVAIAIEATDTVTSAEKTASDTGPDAEQTSTASQQAPSTAQVATIKPAKAVTAASINTTQTTPLPQLATFNHEQQWQARIQAHKLEQKQRMTEMFTRIRSLESEHLEQYKVHQDEQVEHLREQIARQQELIEELILRNKESFEKREASMQRHQTNREQMLNRI